MFKRKKLSAYERLVMSTAFSMVSEMISDKYQKPVTRDKPLPLFKTYPEHWSFFCAAVNNFYTTTETLINGDLAEVPMEKWQELIFLIEMVYTEVEEMDPEDKPEIRDKKTPPERYLSATFKMLAEKFEIIFPGEKNRPDYI